MAIISKTPFLVNLQPVSVSLALVEGVACNIIFSWPFLKNNKASIMNYNNALISVILGEQFKLDMMVPQKSKVTKTSEIIPVLLQVAIPETQNYTEVRGSMDSRV